MAAVAAALPLNCGNFQITYYTNNIKAINKLVMLIKAIKLNKIITCQGVGATKCLGGSWCRHDANGRMNERTDFCGSQTGKSRTVRPRLSMLWRTIPMQLSIQLRECHNE